MLVFWRLLFLREWSFGREIDFLRQFYPERYYAVDSLSSGQFPLWNPFAICGKAFFASYQPGLLYPLNLLVTGFYALINADWSIKAQCALVIFHLWLAGATTYLLGRDLGLRRPAALISGVSFMLCGFLAAHAGHINQASGAAWIPLVFLLFNRSLRARSLRWSVFAGLALGTSLLVGHLQAIFYMCGLLFALAVYYTVNQVREQEAPGSPWFSLGALGVAVLVAVGIAAVQLLPLLELIGQSTRKDMSAGYVSVGSLPRWQGLNLLFPHLFGSSVESYTGAWWMWETYGYTGIVGGGLGVIALLKKPRRFTVFLWVVLILSVILAFGPAGYLWTWLFKMKLFVNQFRDPARVLVIFGFCSSVLAGIGADHLLSLASSEETEEQHRAAGKVAIGLLALSVLVWLSVCLYRWLFDNGISRISGNGIRSALLSLALLAAFTMLVVLAKRSRYGAIVLAVGLLCLVAFDLVYFNTRWPAMRIDPDDMYGDRAAMEYIAAQPGYFRVETDAGNMFVSYDNGAVYGVEKATGDDSLVLDDYSRLRERILPQQSPGVQVGLFREGALQSELLDILNERYFVTKESIDERLTGDKYTLAGCFDGVYVYENGRAMPRAWMTDAFIFNSDDEVNSYMEALDPYCTGITETALVVAEGLSTEYPMKIDAKGKQRAHISSSGGAVSVLENGEGGLKLRVDPSCRGLLLVSELCYPGWEVFVDGVKRDILKTDLALRGVMLDGGASLVEFRYNPSSVRTGAVITVGAIIVLAGYLALAGFRRKKNNPVGAFNNNSGS